MWEGLMRRDANLYYEAGDAVRRFDSRSWVGSLQGPTMVIVNTKDQLMPPRAQYELASFFRVDDVREIPGGRHEAIMNRGDEYVKLINEFADAGTRSDEAASGSDGEE
jgi:pimeloyl-ACP methyl ester carboxylesterase